MLKLGTYVNQSNNLTQMIMDSFLYITLVSCLSAKYLDISYYVSDVYGVGDREHVKGSLLILGNALFILGKALKVCASIRFIDVKQMTSRTVIGEP